MRFLKVKLWGKEIGRLVWDVATRRTYFIYNYQIKDEIPDISPLQSPASKRNVILPVYGDERPIYQGLPPFISDSLPDSWGNTLFDRWVRDNRIPRNKITPLYKLMFIGTRGMGALEYEPAVSDLTHNRRIDVRALYDMSLKVLNDRETAVFNEDDQITMQSLLAVGTSAGGRQMKAVIAIDNKSGEIRSGQIDGLDGMDYCMVKFGSAIMPVSEIETAFYEMAVNAGIVMEESRLFPVDGVNHFLTRRFDRKNGKKVHIQTLAACNPEARSYEDIVATCRALGISESEIEQLYRRLVFNVMSNNTDDHNKNFSFMLEEGGRWHLSPAYDVTFIFNDLGTGPNMEHRMSVSGKTSELSKKDLLEFAKECDIKNAGAIIDDVAKSLEMFSRYADKYGIKQPWKAIIQKTVSDNLVAFGYAEKASDDKISFVDKYGRDVCNAAIGINSKGYYELSAIVDGNRKRRFIRPNMPEYMEVSSYDIYQMSTDNMQRLVEALLPPKE